MVICKQWRPWSDAAFCGVWSGSALFASYPFRGSPVFNGLIIRQIADTQVSETEFVFKEPIAEADDVNHAKIQTYSHVALPFNPEDVSESPQTPAEVQSKMVTKQDLMILLPNVTADSKNNTCMQVNQVGLPYRCVIFLVFFFFFFFLSFLYFWYNWALTQIAYQRHQEKVKLSTNSTHERKAKHPNASSPTRWSQCKTGPNKYN